MPVSLSATRATDWTVVCLCAQWCRTCDGYRDELRALAAADARTRYLWLDIEDEADLVGDLEVATFPTVLVLRGAQPLFYGPVLPQVAQVAQLLARLRGAGDEVRALADLPTEIGPLLNALVSRAGATKQPLRNAP